MTVRELSKLYYINREIVTEKKRLAQLEAAATDTSVNISGLPHVQGISNKTALAAEIADTRAVIEAKINLSIVEYNKINRYIASVEDSMVRQIIALRFIDSLSWYQVECHIGGNNKAESLKKRLYRYLNTHKSCPPMSRP